MSLYPADFVEHYQREGLWTADTFTTFFADLAEKYPDNEAVVGPDYAGTQHRFTYQELQAKISQAAHVLAGRGIDRADYVVVQLPNIVEYVVAIGAVFSLGARPVFALPAHRKTELTHFIGQSEAKALITTGVWNGFDHCKLAWELSHDFAGLTVFIVGDDPQEFSDFALGAWAATTPSTPQTQATDPTDIAFLQVSGGTTGTPKLIPRSHADYLYSVRESARICELSEATRFLVVLPVSHNFTMSSPGILGVLWAGGTIVLCTDPTPSSAFKLVKEEKITLCALVPPLALAWLALNQVLKPDLSTLEVLQVGGAKFTPESAKRVQPELGCRLQQVFGMAEGLVNYTRPEDSEELVVITQGRPMSPFDEVRVVDEDNNDVPSGERGRLLTRGPYTIRGYFHGADQASFTEDGFYASGDLVRQLPSGHLIVEGRDKDQINRGGEKISAEEIEDQLISHPLVYDAAIIAVPDAVQGERSYAFVVRATGSDSAESDSLVDAPSSPDNGAGLDAATLRNYLRDRGVAEYKIPDYFEFAEAFPTTGVGKTNRKELRRIVQQYVSSKNAKEQ
ncbi:MAG: AMP-binding protein [Corynebacterium sp.]|nr:AMP-binding protein [Corynebacterium sp.]